jgi:hypothetical protein
MDSLGDLLKNKADDIDIDSKKDDMHILQAEIDRFYPNSTRILAMSEGKAHIATKSSSIASDLRLQRTTIMQNVNKLLKDKITTLRVSIR